MVVCRWVRLPAVLTMLDTIKERFMDINGDGCATLEHTNSALKGDI